MPQDPSAPDRGRARGAKQVVADRFNCLGRFGDARPQECTALRFVVTSGPQLAGEFKVPFLRDVASRVPYTHAGRLRTLREVLEHYNRAPRAQVGHSELHPLDLSDAQLDDLEAFLRTLDGGVTATEGLPAGAAASVVSSAIGQGRQLASMYRASNRQDQRVRAQFPHEGVTVTPADHHSTYLAKAVAALTPEGRKRVDELLDQLAVAGRSHEWVVRFAMAREAEADTGQTNASTGEEPGERLSETELDIVTAGFMTIRDQEPLDDVADWANAVLALLADERA